jgi:hypothetical protein
MMVENTVIEAFIPITPRTILILLAWAGTTLAIYFLPTIINKIQKKITEKRKKC